MAKDPAFLFYSKDWLEGTMELTAEEKGVYIDLLAHQHQKESLPSETKRLCKLVGISEVEFIPIWNGIKQKFKPTDNDRIHNLKLTGVVTERLETGRKNKVIGIFATVVRQSKKPVNLKAEAKKGFRLDDFLPLPDHLLTERITEWFTERLASLEDGNGNGNEDANKNEDSKEGGAGEEKLIVPQMCKLWYETFPKYTQDRIKDFDGMGAILKFIFKNSPFPRDIQDNDFQIKILNTLQLIADQVNREPFWLNKPIKSIANNIQEFYNKIKNPIDGKQSASNKQQSTPNLREGVAAISAKRRAERQQTANKSDHQAL